MPPKKINQLSGMPKMVAAFDGWMIALNFSVVSQNIVDGFVVDTETPLTVQGTWQPLSAEEIALKPDGQRSWSWFDLHIKGNDVPFVTNDRIVYNGEKYKVMTVKDYSLNNYSEFHVVKDYQEA